MQRRWQALDYGQDWRHKPRVEQSSRRMSSRAEGVPRTETKEVGVSLRTSTACGSKFQYLEHVQVSYHDMLVNTDLERL